ncbi:MAG: hypothetical protein ABI647_07100 [Gemmatimonadota bacterium]
MASPVTGKQPPAPSLAARERMVLNLAHRGVRGGVIEPHRSMLVLPEARRRLVTSSILALTFLVGVALSLGPLGRFWLLLVERAHESLGFASIVDVREFNLFGVLSFNLPVLGIQAAIPDGRTLLIATAITGAILLVTLALRGRLIPVAYFLRAMVVIQATAIFYFAVWGAHFPYRLPGFFVGLLTSGLLVIGLVPLLLGFTYYIYDVTWTKKIGLTAAILAHLAIFIPLQAMVIAYLIIHLSLVVMPVLFLMFGLVLDVMIFVAFYGWGMSWDGVLGEERRRR